MSEKPNWPPELVERARQLLVEQIKTGKTITSLDFKMALRAAVGLSYNVVQADVSKFLKASMFKNGKCGHGYCVDDGGGFLMYVPDTVKSAQTPVPPEDVSLERFELLLAKLYAVRSEDGLKELEGKLRTIQAEYRTRPTKDLNASSELAAAVYDKLDAQVKTIEETGGVSDQIFTELMLAMKKRYAVWCMLEPDHKREIQAGFSLAKSPKSQVVPETEKSETSLASTALGCLAAVAAMSVAPKLFKQTKPVEEAVR